MFSIISLFILILAAVVSFFLDENKYNTISKPIGSVLLILGFSIFLFLNIDASNFSIISARISDQFLVGINFCFFGMFFLLNKRGMRKQETLYLLAFGLFTSIFFMANSMFALILGLSFLYILLITVLLWIGLIHKKSIVSCLLLLLLVPLLLVFVSNLVLADFKEDSLLYISDNIFAISNHGHLSVLLFSIMPLGLILCFLESHDRYSKMQANLKLFLSLVLPNIMVLMIIKLMNNFPVMELAFGKRTHFQDIYRLSAFFLILISNLRFFFRPSYYLFFSNWNLIYGSCLLLFYSLGTSVSLAWCIYGAMFSCIFNMVFVYILSRINSFENSSFSCLQKFASSFNKEDRALLVLALVLSLCLVNRGHLKLMQGAIEQLFGTHSGTWGMGLFFVVLAVAIGFQLVQLVFFSHGLLKKDAENAINLPKQIQLTFLSKVILFFPLILLGIYPSPLYKYILKLIL